MSSSRASAPWAPRPSPAHADTLAVACPLCTVMLDDGVKARGSDMRVVDVSTLIAESLDECRTATAA